MTREADDDLGRVLLAAAQRDRAPQAVRRALLERAQTKPVPLRAGRRIRLAAWQWLSAAALFGAALAVWLTRAETGATPSISAERIAPRSNDDEPAPRTGPEGTPNARALPAPPARPGHERSKPHPTPRSSRKNPASASAPAPAPASASAIVPEPPSFSSQLKLLERARSALRAGDSARALELLVPYSNELRGTALEAEAMLLRIEALSLAGREPEARALAEQFLLQYPNSPLSDRARRFIAPPRTSSSP